MPVPISGSTYSAFPNLLDTFPEWRDGQGIDCAISADIWNHIEHALYQTQTHSQNNIRMADSTGNRKRITLRATLTPGVSGLVLQSTVTLTAQMMAFLGQQPFAYGNALLAAVYRTDDTTPIVTMARPSPPNQVVVSYRNADFNTPVPVGTYRLQVTLIGS